MHPSTITAFIALASIASAGPTITNAPPSSSTCSLTLCADYINSCGQTYGGCYPACSGYTTPSFTDPGCPPTTKPVPPTITSCTQSLTKSTTTSKPCSTTCTEILCQDFVNSCGQWYGGCFPVCSGLTTPTFTDPGCPTSIATPTATSTK